MNLIIREKSVFHEVCMKNFCNVKFSLRKIPTYLNRLEFAYGFMILRYYLPTIVGKFHCNVYIICVWKSPKNFTVYFKN